jgi:excisionase family DNA binding protein
MGAKTWVSLSRTKLSPNQQRRPEVQPLLDTNGAAAILGVSPRTLSRLVSSGAISHRKIGRQVRFAQDDISEYVDKCHVPIGSTQEREIATPTLKWIASVSQQRGRAQGIQCR